MNKRKGKKEKNTKTRAIKKFEGCKNKTASLQNLNVRLQVRVCYRRQTCYTSVSLLKQR